MKNLDSLILKFVRLFDTSAISVKITNKYLDN